MLQTVAQIAVLSKEFVSACSHNYKIIKFQSAIHGSRISRANNSNNGRDNIYIGTRIYLVIWARYYAENKKQVVKGRLGFIDFLLPHYLLGMDKLKYNICKRYCKFIDRGKWL